MTAELKKIFDSLSEGNHAPLISLAERRIEEFKAMSFEEKYQTLLRLAVELGDHGMTGDVKTFDKMTMAFLNRGFTAYFNEDEFQHGKEELKAQGMENPTDEAIILHLRTNYRGEAPPSDEPLKLTLLYDHFRTNRWVVRPEEALLFLEVPKGTDKNLVATMDCLIVSKFGQTSRPNL